jgi:hypothetical protein
MPKSRADYLREYRKDLKQFNVTLKKEKVEALEEILKKRNQTKTAWLEEKIDEELKHI